MPGGDRTGPRGLGSMTGRGLGYCSGYNNTDYIRSVGLGYGRGYGRGMGLGAGCGRGYGRRYGRGYGYGDPIYPPYIAPAPVYAPIPPLSVGDQATMLKQEKDYLESELKGIANAIEDISKRIEELEKKE
jgi:hypothetical protein